MKIDFTPTGGSLATLGDDANRYTVVVEQLGGNAIVQSESLASAANPALFTRGNIGGDLVFRSSKTYVDYKSTFVQFKTEYSRLNQKGTIVLTEANASGSVTMTFANAILKSVQRIFDGQNSGAHMGIRYTFAITTIT